MVFGKALIDWYHTHKRDLPWRHTRNPYFIWISEIILQQTRVQQGYSYYLRFVEAFPTIEDLANAPLERVLKVWQGLGYYTRARNIHQTAKSIVSDFDGRLPESYDALIKLKGIGDYTAAAIASFAFDEPVAAIDGNVYRIYSRIFGIYAPVDKGDGKRALRQIASDELDRETPALFNQAIMDLGGQICLPKNPLCEECPVNAMCYAYKSKETPNLPVKSVKVKVRDRFFYYIIVMRGSSTFIRQRDQKDIWHSLFEFPLVEVNRRLSLEELPLTAEWLDICGAGSVEIAYISNEVKHVLSHQHLYTRFFVVRVDRPSYFLKQKYMEISSSTLHNYSTPRLIDNFLAAEPLEKYCK
ncbi:MAG TPA: A/G-specific adenine glycosylase [Williamwhitmania sp.]|nr:A/G-specific adenine glycosylase [Williamwhitmania sp.]